MGELYAGGNCSRPEMSLLLGDERAGGDGEVKCSRFRAGLLCSPLIFCVGRA